ncbi:hypothetical protein KY49_3598 [Burkholderia sp. MSHR3999]|uniref:hypothetical protein n=1 Tax=Burkholderia sp. MSHR3999 TaxID=1542965 RepID=UPI0005AC0258|nr:hypothetical protein [Burkholderia sp. MSHR3999]KIP18467.1 hypothetical protein KY49_3598 [Burkholderia sp. MSHR3999]
MFRWLKWINDRTKRNAVEEFCNKWRFHLYDEYGFVVDGLLVSEFGYLLRYVTSGKHDSFKNFEAIADDYAAIDGAIFKEMSKAVPKEAEVNFTSPDGARRNLENMRYIVKAITEYVALAKTLELPINPLLSDA